jgi:hypothetical protein
VRDVQIQRAAAGDEAVDLRRGGEAGESRDEMRVAEVPTRPIVGFPEPARGRRAGDVDRATCSRDIRGRVRVRYGRTWADTRSRNREGR